jgi:hypothetical protein
MNDGNPEFKPAQKLEQTANGLMPIPDDEWPLYEWRIIETLGNPTRDVYVRGKQITPLA